MAIGLPFFKFNPTEWLTGDIVFESFEVQGLFINICALYWQRNAKVSIEDINKRFNKPKALPKLTDRFFMVIDGFIIIKFLDEQLLERRKISEDNSKNGKKGGRPKALKTLNKKPTALQNKPTESGLKQTPSKEEEEKEEEKDMCELKISDCELPKNSLEFKIIESSIRLYESLQIAFPLNRDIPAFKVSEVVPYVRELMQTKKYSYDQIREVVNFANSDPFWKDKTMYPASIAKNFEKMKAKYQDAK